MTTLPFVFNHRTGDLVRLDGEREDVATTLNMLQAAIFGALSLATLNGVPVGTGAIAKAINEHEDDVEDELPGLIRRLQPLGIRIAYEHGRGRWLQFEPPPKFELRIPPPVRLEGEV
jgi:hypothetical protein